jgi:gliding motility-associated-like protein
MKKTRLHLCLSWLPLFILVFIPYRQYGQINILPNQTAVALAQKLAGPGITVTNASLTCAAPANGEFTVVSSNLGIDSGIVLTTGKAQSVAAAEPGLTSFNNNTNGDPELQVLSGAATTRDACILEFDLVPKGDTVKFDYVFGSEEYINSVCGPYNDAFAFFISGPGIAGTQNMAQVPGTTIPVAVNSINNGIPGTYGSLPNCTSMGAGSPFTGYYNNNQGGATVAYRGLTAVLTAAHAVTPCNTYHLKLTIADAVNGLYDSGVFIKAGSLQSTTFNMDVTAPVTAGGTPAIYKGCAPATFTFSRSVAKPTPQTLNYLIQGTAVNGTDYATIGSSIIIPANATQATLSISGIVTPPSGMKTLKLLLFSPYSCNGSVEMLDSLELHIYDKPGAVILTNDTTICDRDHINISVEGDAALQYNWSPAMGLSSPVIQNPDAEPAATTTYVMHADIPGSGCGIIEDSIKITVLPRPVSVLLGEDIHVCEHTPILITPDIQPDHESFTYQWAGPHGFNTMSKELSITDPIVQQSGLYLFHVDGGVCGVVTDTVLIDIVEFPMPPVVKTPVKYCVNEKAARLDATGANLRWYPDAFSMDASTSPPEINTAIPGTYDFYVSQSYGTCESERLKISVIVERCCDDNVFIPTVFTPNQDGQNDFFDITVMNGSRVTQLNIFNRWGQKIFGQSGRSTWNGTYNGTTVDLGNYYYMVEITCKDGTIIYKKGEVLVVK